MKPAEITGQDAARAPVLPQRAAVMAAALGLAAAWVAAGSVGLLAHSLRHGLTWTLLVAAAIVAWPWRDLRGKWPWLVASALAFALAMPMIASPLSPLGVLAVALVLLALGHMQAGAGRTAMGYAAVAIGLLALYRVTYLSIPLVWMQADSLSAVLGRIAGLLAGRHEWGPSEPRPLWIIGPTMGGLDFLLPMLLLAVMLGWSVRRLGQAPDRECKPVENWSYKPLRNGLLLVLAGQLLYLVVLIVTVDNFKLPAPTPPAPATAGQEVPAGTSELPAALARFLPWNLPAVAAAIQTVIAWVLLRRFVRASGEVRVETSGARRSPLWVALALACAAALLAAALPLVTVLSWSKPRLAGKKIVFYEKGYLNWLKPEHGDYGRLSVGMYGMLPTFLELFGAEAIRSPDLSEADLKGADALVIIYPNKPWEKGQLERIWNFVRNGGSLLVMGEHTVREDDGGNRFNEVLEPTDMRVPFDSAIFGVGGWLHSYDAMAHPTTAGISDERNTFGVVIGASVAGRWPARPLLVGRIGWTDIGDAKRKEHAMLGNHFYDPGEKLGDVVLAAEQPLGKGRVISFGDPSGLTNGLNPGCHHYVSRLFAYLAGGGDSPQSPWRQWAGLAVALVLAAILLWQPHLLRLAAFALPLAVSLWACTAITHRNWELLPDGNLKSPNNLAYIDSGHVNADTLESWREDGLGALHLTLVRNGYLPLSIGELTRERLLEEVKPESEGQEEAANQTPDFKPRAALLVVAAPDREFSSSERIVVRDFVRWGGNLIYMAGRERFGPNQDLLEGLGFQVEGPWLMAKGKAQACSERSLTLSAADENGELDYLNCWLAIQAEDKAEQKRRIVAYDPKTKVARLDRSWSPVPEQPPEYTIHSDEMRALRNWADVRHRGPHFKSPYFRTNDYEAFVRFHAAWPVYCKDLNDFEPGPDGRKAKAASITFFRPCRSIILWRKCGEARAGRVVLIGDTGFAMTKNLEREDGQPIEGKRENADFWRWLLSELRARRAEESGMAAPARWYPPNPNVQTPPGPEPQPPPADAKGPSDEASKIEQPADQAAPPKAE